MQGLVDLNVLYYTKKVNHRKNSVTTKISFPTQSYFTVARNKKVDYPYSMNYSNLLLVVTDLKKSLKFYETVLQQKVLYNLGSTITFESGICLIQKDSFSPLLPKRSRINPKPLNAALYFEEEELSQLESTLKRKKIEILNPVEEQPWGQKVIRFLDPDGHLIEVGQPMSALIKELSKEGLSSDEISKKTNLPINLIEIALSKKRK